MSEQGMMTRQDFISSLTTVPTPAALKDLITEADADNAKGIYNNVAEFMRENPMKFLAEVDVSEYFYTSKEEVVSLVSEAFATSGWSLIVREEKYFIQPA